MSKVSGLSDDVILEVGEVVGETNIINQVQTGTTTTTTLNGCDDMSTPQSDVAFNLFPYTEYIGDSFLQLPYTVGDTVSQDCDMQTAGGSQGGGGTMIYEPIDKLIGITLLNNVNPINFQRLAPAQQASQFIMLEPYNSQNEFENVQGRSLYMIDRTNPTPEVFLFDIVDAYGGDTLLVKGNGQDHALDLQSDCPKLYNGSDDFDWYVSAFQHSANWDSMDNNSLTWTNNAISHIMSYEGNKNQANYRVNTCFDSKGRLGMRSADFNYDLEFWEVKIDVGSITNATIDVFTDNPSNTSYGTYPTGVLDTITTSGVHTFCIPKLKRSTKWNGDGSLTNSGCVNMTGGSSSVAFNCFAGSIDILEAKAINNLNQAGIVINSIEIVNKVANTTTVTTPVYSQVTDFNIDQIDWKRLDIYDSSKTPISLNFSVGGLTSFKKKGGGFSKTFDIPYSNNNKEVLDPMLAVNSQKEKINWMKARVTSKGIEVFNGLIRVEVGKTGLGSSYSCHLIEDTLDWVGEIGDDSIRDLAFPMVEKSYQSIIDSWSNTPNEGYVFGLVNYGKWWMQQIDVATNYDKTLNDFRPNIFTKTIVDKIFDKIGYTIESNFFNSPAFKAKIHPYCSGTELAQDDVYGSEGANNVRVARSVKTTCAGNFAAGGKIPANGYNRTWYPNLIPGSDLGNHWNGNGSNSGYVVPFAGDYDISAKAKLYISQNFLAAYSRLFMKVCVNGVEVISHSKHNAVSGISSGIVVSGNTIQSLNPGDVISYKILAKNSSNFYAAWMDVSDMELVVFPIQSSVVPVTNINLNNSLNDIKQTEFLKGLTEVFNLQWIGDSESKKIYVEPYDDFFGSGKTVDWTNKLDHKTWTDKFIIKDLAKDVTFKYAVDDNITKDMNEILATEGKGEIYSLNIENPERFRKETLELGTKVFASTIMFDNSVVTTSAGTATWHGDETWNGVGNWNPVIPVIWGSDGVVDRLHNSVREDYNPKPSAKMRILNYYSTYTSTAYDFVDENGNVHNHNTYPLLGVYNKHIWNNTSAPTDELSLSWADEEVPNGNIYDGLFTKYWKNAYDRMNGGAVLRSCMVNLDATDIAIFDYRDIVHIKIDDVATYWIVNKIIDYQPNENGLTKVELIEWSGIENSVSTTTNSQTRLSNTRHTIATRAVTRSADGGTGIGDGVIVAGEQVAVGRYNEEDSNAVFMVGAGDDESNRHTVMTVTKDGDAFFHGGTLAVQEKDGIINELVYSDKEGNIKKVYLKK